MEIVNQLWEKKYKNFRKSYTSLERGIAIKYQYKGDEELHEIFLSAVIKRFELCYEMAWKFLKVYVERVYEEQCNSPRNVFTFLRDRGIITADFAQKLLELVEIRNLTTHTYNEIMAQELVEDITKHYQALGNLFVVLPGIKDNGTTD